MLLQQLVQMKALKEGQMKNAIMDTVEDHCRNADIPKGVSYEQAVKAIVRSIQQTDTVASECSPAELATYVKDYFPKDEYVAEDEEPMQGENPDTSSDQGPQVSAPAAPNEQPPQNQAPTGPEQIGKAGDFVVMLDQKSETVTLTKGGQSVVSMPLVIWTQLKRS